MTRQPNTEPQEPVSPDRKRFSENLIRLRQERGWTQEELAKASGVGQSHISRLEKGTWEPRFGTIMALAQALGVQPGELMPQIVENPPPP